MKTLITVLVTLLLSNCALAETHGGVTRSNAGFSAVAEYALDQGGDLSRVFSIQKLYKIPCASGDLYKITWGSMDSDGVEHADKNATYVLVEVSLDTSKSIVIEANGPSCTQ